MERIYTHYLKRQAILLLFLSSFVGSFAQEPLLTLEAEAGTLTAPAKVKQVNGYSGNAYVGDNDAGSAILFENVIIPQTGTYEFKTYYSSMQLRSIAVKANNFVEVISTIVNTTPDWNAPPTGVMSVYIYLNAGQNTIKITPYPVGQGGPNMDKFEILTTDVVIPEPGEFPLIFEAENAQLFGSLKVKPTDGSTLSGLSGGRYVGDFNQSANSYMKFVDIEIPETGTYELRVFSMGSGRRLSIKVNQYEKIIITTNDSPNWNDAPTATVSTLIYMDKGKNKITLGTHNDDGPNLDKLEIHTTDQTIPKPTVEKLAFISDFSDNAEITAQHNNETLSYLTDNDEYTFYKAEGVNSTQITAKCQYPILLTGYLFSTGIASDADLSQWELESSINGQSWTKIIPNSYSDLSGAFLFSVNRTSAEAAAKAAQYYRLTAKGENKVEVAEWQLFGVPYIANSDNKTFPVDITEDIDIQMKATAYPEGEAGDGWNETFYNLFNRDLTRKYFVVGSKSYYVEIELDKQYKLHAYTLTSVDNFPERDPKKWTLNGFNPETGWVELDRQTEFDFPCRFATMRFDINANAGFTKFLLDVEDNHGSSDSQLLKWQLFGEEYNDSGIDKLENGKYSVWSGNGKINIASQDVFPIDYQVFNLSGMLLSKDKITNSTQEVYLPQGMYIVKINQEINSKVIVY
ncbi:MAG: hypothetical protein LBS25_01890 [Candidatus Symbiothrix sp.]|nr:hypothetical protein [Candidatus Symbiothrix sp.]